MHLNNNIRRNVLCWSERYCYTFPRQHLICSKIPVVTLPHTSWWQLLRYWCQNIAILPGVKETANVSPQMLFYDTGANCQYPTFGGGVLYIGTDCMFSRLTSRAHHSQWPVLFIGPDHSNWYGPSNEHSCLQFHILKVGLELRSCPTYLHKHRSDRSGSSKWNGH